MQASHFLCLGAAVLEACGESRLLQLLLPSPSTPDQVRGTPGQLATCWWWGRWRWTGGLPHTRGSGTEVRGRSWRGLRGLRRWRQGWGGAPWSSGWGSNYVCCLPCLWAWCLLCVHLTRVAPRRLFSETAGRPLTRTGFSLCCSRAGPLLSG